MNRLLSLMAVITLILLQGCNFEEQVKPLDPQNESYKVQIYSEINQQPATKVTTDGFCTGDEVGVYLVNYDGATPGTLKVEENQADNVRFTYDDKGNWISDYDIFYKDDDTNVDIYGYYPYAEPSSIEAYPFEVARDQSKAAEHGQLATYEASDFLWAKTKNVKPTSSKVILSFYHKMSSARIRFSQGEGWADAAEYAAVSKEVIVTSTIRKSTIDLSSGEVTPQGEVPLTGIVPLNDNGEFRAIVVPQTVAAGQNLLVITIDGNPRYYTRDIATEYLPGKITTYDFNVNKQKETGKYELELTGVNITAWEADNVSHSEDAREYVVVHNAVAGGLERTIVERLEMDPTKIKNLKLTGEITTLDYIFMNNKMPNLQRLNLKEIESIVNGIYEIPNSAFDGKSTLVKLVLPDKLERIGYNAFNATSLTGSVHLPEGLKYVSGFSNTKITNVYFPSTLEEIGVNAFSSCTSLMCEVSFPESLKIINSHAFYNSSIKGNLLLPHNLETIGNDAFASCSELTGSLVIPDRVKIIPYRTFQKCGFTGTLTLPKGLEKIENRAFSETKFKGELNIPSGVSVIESNAFESTLFNGTIVLPKELISLGTGVFKDCSRLSGVVEIPDNIIAIPSSLFYGCTGIREVKLHKDVEVIESQAFNNCFGIYSIVCEAKTPPTINSNSFNGVAKDNFTLEVPEASVNLYKNDSNWSEFKRITAHREFGISRSLYRTLNAEYSKTFVLRAPAGENWSVESKPDWVIVEPMSGTGKMDVVVTTNALTKGAGNRSGEIKFLLNGKDYRSTMTVEQYDYQYGDGNVIKLQEAKIGDGVNIVILGDCFDAKDISEGKYFSAMQEAYGYFFDIEPYLTYKDYFNVYGVFGMSADSGMGTVNTIREARFGSQYTLNEGVSPDFETTFAAACLAPINDEVSRTLVIVIENSSDYSGCCYMWGDGSAVAIVPMSTDPAPYDFRGLVHHEAGGHGFGKLGDEGIKYNQFITELAKDAIRRMKTYGFYDNLSLESNFHTVDWSHMIYDSQYSTIVDIYEGGYGYTRGVFRSEPTSCMNNNIPYYNAISREAMVKRIKKYAGEEYSFDEFKVNDKESLPSVAVKSDWIWLEDSIYTSPSFDQMPPKFMGEKPSFKKSDF